MRPILLLLGLVAAALILAVRMLPWWGLLALLLVLILGTPILLKRGLMRLLTAPFKAKGAVLADAGAQVHSVQRTAAPAEPDGEDTAERGPREHYLVEVTITPRGPSGPFMLWEPGELVLVAAGTRPGMPDTDDAVGEVSRLEILQDGAFAPDAGMKYEGPQRLRMLMAVPPGQARVRFRYYFEVFGDVPFPAERERAPAPAGPAPARPSTDRGAWARRSA